MPFQPEKITHEHVLRAIEKIEKEKLRLNPSLSYNVKINSKTYPPKEVMRYAHQEMNGEYIWNHPGGDPTNKYLKAMGFEIENKNAHTLDAEISFFKKEDLEFYNTLIETDATYRKNDPEDVQNAERIKNGIFEKTNYWVKLVCDQLADFEYEEDNAWNVSGNIKRYSWARLFLKGQRHRKFFVTVGVNAGMKCLVYKFDCQREGGQKLHDTEIQLFDSFAKRDKRDWQEIDAASIEKFDWESLTLATVDFINENLDAFKELHGLKQQAPGRPNAEKIELNTILYGPPGTGKTYHTINIALAIIENKPVDVLKTEDRASLTRRFQNYLNSGQIAFTSFHQSMSYEDFIEGLKPLTPSDDEAESTEDDDRAYIEYDLVPGIFKNLCEKARSSLNLYKDFDELWAGFFQALMKEKQVIFKSTESEMRMEKELTTENSLKIRFSKSWDNTKTEGTRVFAVSKETIRKIFAAGVDASPNAPNQWLNVKNVVNAGRATLSLGVYKKFWEYAQAKGAFSKEQEMKPYVLIIDEINRGNVSQIFGELITLIEEDKREGMPEALAVKLPYSKKPFSVPKNVFVLGTMNTADRSVEALDSALRRRFSFEFMPPESKAIAKNGKDILVNGIKLGDVLDCINERITYFLDEDHQIGHAYFCAIEQDDVDHLRRTFRNKIVPLLREYFYNDHAKIRMVLGDRFVVKSNVKPRFPVKDEEGLILDKSSYQIAPIDNEFDIIGALRETLNGKA